MSGRLVVATAALFALASCGSSSPGTQDPTKGSDRGPPSDGPNIVVVMSDDQDAASLGQAMPRTKRLARTGTTFTDFVVTTPSCCPSRAAFITGEYGHNNGVLANVPGYPDLLQKENVLPAWLRRAGYRTAEFGKFMNGYENFATAMGALRGPGWDHWEALLPPYAYFDYDLSINDVRRHFGVRDRDYVDRVLTRRALRFIAPTGPPAGRSSSGSTSTRRTWWPPESRHAPGDAATARFPRPGMRTASGQAPSPRLGPSASATSPTSPSSSGLGGPWMRARRRSSSAPAPAA